MKISRWWWLLRERRSMERKGSKYLSTVVAARLLTRSAIPARVSTGVIVITTTRSTFVNRSLYPASGLVASLGPIISLTSTYKMSALIL